VAEVTTSRRELASGEALRVNLGVGVIAARGGWATDGVV
jgi:hypothetical protein